MKKNLALITSFLKKLFWFPAPESGTQYESDDESGLFPQCLHVTNPGRSDAWVWNSWSGQEAALACGDGRVQKSHIHLCPREQSAPFVWLSDREQDVTGSSLEMQTVDWWGERHTTGHDLICDNDIISPPLSNGLCKPLTTERSQPSGQISQESHSIYPQFYISLDSSYIQGYICIRTQEKKGTSQSAYY